MHCRPAFSTSRVKIASYSWYSTSSSSSTVMVSQGGFSLVIGTFVIVLIPLAPRPQSFGAVVVSCLHSIFKVQVNKKVTVSS
jgi:hypothetical protein